MKFKENIGELISNARKNKNMTQTELASKLKISNKAISNWEQERNLPDILMAKEIEKILNIEIIKKDKKILKKKCITYIGCIISVILLLFLLLYFISNFNQIKIYEITLESELYKLYNSHLFITNNNIYLEMSNIERQTDMHQYEYKTTLYYLDENGRHDIIKKESYKGLSIKENRGDYYFFNEKFLKNKDNLFIEIVYEDKESIERIESIKLNLKLTEDNGKLLYKKAKRTLSNDKNQINLLVNNSYSEIEKNVFQKKYTHGIFYYDLESESLWYKGQKNDLTIQAKIDLKNKNFNSQTRDFEYVVSKNKQSIEESDNKTNSSRNKYEQEIYQIIMEEAYKIIIFEN